MALKIKLLIKIAHHSEVLLKVDKIPSFWIIIIYLSLPPPCDVLSQEVLSYVMRNFITLTLSIYLCWEYPVFHKEWKTELSLLFIWHSRASFVFLWWLTALKLLATENKVQVQLQFFTLQCFQIANGKPDYGEDYVY